MKAQTKRRIANGFIWGMVGVGVLSLIGTAILVWVQKGPALGLGLLIGPWLLLGLALWISSWAHAED